MSELTVLLPPSSAFTLAYALPLLLLSVVQAFAGSFLTLDRTRVFPPTYDAIPGDLDVGRRRSTRRWLLQGGVGGIIIGYAFGVHFSTFLALLVPNKSSSAPLGSKSFLAVWVLASLPTLVVAARWAIAALFLSGLTGGALFSLALCVIIHPSLLTRVVLVSASSILLALFILLPLPSTRHGALRVSTAATGAFGIIISIALLGKISSWVNIWERLWVSNGEAWGNSRERALSAGFCLIFVSGVVSDWLLRRKFGECPDQKWDQYLAKYTTNLPGREGSFRPLRNFWDHAFRRTGAAHDTTHPPQALIDEDLKDPPPMSLYKLRKGRVDPSGPSSHAQPFEFTPVPGFLKKGRSHSQTRLKHGAGRRKDIIKFNPSGENLSSDSEDDTKDPLASLGPTSSAEALQQRRSRTPRYATAPTTGRIHRSSSAGPTLDYSDYEQDLASAEIGTSTSPRFLKQKQKRLGSNSSSTADSQQTAVEHQIHPATQPPLMPVPVTPSLIKALDRVSAAQKAAFSTSQRPGLPPSKPTSASGDGLFKPKSHPFEAEEEGNRWDMFWRDVQGKADHHAS